MRRHARAEALATRVLSVVGGGAGQLWSGAPARGRRAPRRAPVPRVRGLVLARRPAAAAPDAVGARGQARRRGPRWRSQSGRSPCATRSAARGDGDGWRSPEPSRTSASRRSSSSSASSRRPACSTCTAQARRSTSRSPTAASSAPRAAGRKTRERLGNMLVRAELIESPRLDRALDLQKRTLHRLGDVLVEEGLVSKAALTEMTALQTTETVYRLFHWKRGTYEFEPGEVDWDRETVTPLRAESVLMEGFRHGGRVAGDPQRITSTAMTFERLGALEPARTGERAAAGGADVDAAFDAFGEAPVERKGELHSVATNERRVRALAEPGRDGRDDRRPLAARRVRDLQGPHRPREPGTTCAPSHPAGRRRQRARTRRGAGAHASARDRADRRDRRARGRARGTRRRVDARPRTRRRRGRWATTPPSASSRGAAGAPPRGARGLPRRARRVPGVARRPGRRRAREPRATSATRGPQT